MAVGDTTDSADGLREVSPATVADARHFDQLSHAEQHAFLQLRRGNDPGATPLSPGEVIVFTDYYRVER